MKNINVEEMTKKQMIFWDNIDFDLLEEFRRQKAIAKFKKQIIRYK